MIKPSTHTMREFELLDRIRAGVTTAADADWLAARLERLAIYEATLKVVAVHGSGATAMLAARALAEPESVVLRAHELERGEGGEDACRAH